MFLESAVLDPCMREHLVGSATQISYSLYKGDIEFVAGTVIGGVIYSFWANFAVFELCHSHLLAGRLQL